MTAEFFHDLHLQIIAPIELSLVAPLTRVVRTSPIRHRELAFMMADYFNSEVPTALTLAPYFIEADEGVNQEAWLLAKPTVGNQAQGMIVIGGAGFIRLQADVTFRMRWLWVHPFERHLGHLRSHWQTMRLAYGEDTPFGIEAPLSLSMQSFHAKYATDHQIIDRNRELAQ